MDAKVIWSQRLSFQGESDSGFKVNLGNRPEVGLDSDGFPPMELIAIGLAGCTAMDVISILQKKRQDISRFEVRVHAERSAEHPKVFTQAEIEYFITGNQVQEEAVLRAIELSATRYCPAQVMFSRVFPIELRYHIFEGTNDQGTKPIKSGAVHLPTGEVR
jgi:putative redox protein